MVRTTTPANESKPGPSDTLASGPKLIVAARMRRHRRRASTSFRLLRSGGTAWRGPRRRQALCVADVQASNAMPEIFSTGTAMLR